MNLLEIRRANCQFDKYYSVEKSDEGSIPLYEQECHINVQREDGNGAESIEICCSHQPMLTQLFKSEYFIVDELLVSNHNARKDAILQVKGRLELKGLTIRKKKHVFTAEEKQKRAEAAKTRFAKK